jgi:hypothetical protein
MTAFILLASAATGDLWTSYLIVSATIIGALVAGRTGRHLLMYAFGSFGLLYGAIATHTHQQAMSFDGQRAALLQQKLDQVLATEASHRALSQNCITERDSLQFALQQETEKLRQLQSRPARPVARVARVAKKAPAVNRPRTDPRFQYIGDFRYGLAPVRALNGKWGYIDASYRQVVPNFLKVACTLHAGMGGVRNEAGKWGFVDSKGKLVIPYLYDDALAFEEKTGQALVQMGATWYWIDREGTVLREASDADLRARHRV